MGHKKVYGFDDNMCRKETLTRDDFAIIQKTITSEKQISYPNGFNMNNCVVISTTYLDGQSWCNWDKGMLLYDDYLKVCGYSSSASRSFKILIRKV